MSELNTNANETHEEVVTVTEGGIAASLGLNAQLFAFQLINFAIVALVVWYLILKPLTKKLEERKKIIDESLDNAKKVETNLFMAEQKFQEKVDEAKVAANKIIEKSHDEAEQLSVDMKDKAKTEIEKLVGEAKVKIKEEKEEVMRGVKAETASLVVAAVEKILEEKLDEKKDRELIDKSLKELKK